MNNYEQVCATVRTTRRQAHAAGYTVPYAWLMNSRAFAGLVASHPDAKQRARMLKGRYLLVERKRVPVVLDEATTDVYYLPVKQINSRQLRRDRRPPTDEQLQEAAAKWTI